MLSYFFFLSEIYTLLFILFVIVFSTSITSLKYRVMYTDTVRFLTLLSVFFIAMLLLFIFFTPAFSLHFDYGLRSDCWSLVSKGLIVFFSFFYFLVLYANRRPFVHFEFLIIVLSLVLSALVLVCSGDFLILFLSLDLQAICLFTLIAYNNVSMKATEAAWKYFILNGFASCLILLGVCLLYFYSNSISFVDLRIYFSLSDLNNEGFLIWFGLLSLVLGFLIKIGVAPFHQWLIDVFDGTSEILLPVLGIISKIGQFSILFYFLLSFGQESLIHIVFLSGFFSVVVGSLQILFQSRIKKQMALLSVYSSGIVLAFFANPFLLSCSFGFFYLFISNLLLFLYMHLCLFITNLSNNKTVLDNVFNLSLLSRNQFTLSIIISLIFVSLLGLPPLIGFFPKFFFLYCLSNYLILAYTAIFLLLTLLMIFVFINMIKDMFFSVESQDFVGTLSVSPISVLNLYTFFFFLIISFFLLFFGASYILESILLGLSWV